MFGKLFSSKSPNPPGPPDYPSLGQRAAKGDTEASKAILEGARCGNGDAQLEAGFLYAKGWTVEQSDEVAADWYERAAAQGVLNAQFNLGCMHFLGHGFERSPKNALRWFELAAKGGHARAQQNIPAMQAQAAFLAQEQLLHDALGINKVAGLQDLSLARGYVANLKKLTQDNEVRDALQLHKSGFGVPTSVALAAQKCLMLIRNVSSATPLTVDVVLDCAIYNAWEALDSKLAESD